MEAQVVAREDAARQRSRMRVVRAEPPAIFEVLRNPRRHQELDGSGMLRGRPRGPERLVLGSRFTMGMQQFGWGYRSVNRVVELEEDRLITWETTGELAGRRLMGGQRWSFGLETLHGEGTLVTHTYDWSRAVLPRLTIELPGYPSRMERALEATWERLAGIVE